LGIGYTADDEDRSAPKVRHIRSPVTTRMLRPLEPIVELVQWPGQLSDEEYRKVAHFMRENQDVPLRVWGRLESVTFLKYFEFVRHFNLDAYNLQDLEGLRYLPPSLRSLGLGRTKKTFSLKILQAFPELRKLYLEGHRKDIDAISSLDKLERLTLRSVTLPDLSPLVPLRNLWWLAIKLGGTKNLRLLPSVGRLKYLELWQILGFSDIEPVGDVETLQLLQLQSLRRITHLPSFRKLKNLRALWIDTMRGLSDLSPLEEAQNLEDLGIIAAPNIRVEQLEPLKRLPSLRRVTIGLGSMKRNLEVEQLFNMPNAFHERTGFQYR
jgi:hypothetical protein